MSRILCFSLCLIAVALNSGNHSLSAATKKQVEVQKFCPVFTDRVVGPNSRWVRHHGIKVYFSSDLAARKWMRDPESYVDVELVPQLGDLIQIERPFPQHYCPVFPKRKVSLKDPSLIYQGKRVFLFDKEALRIWNSAPEKFLNPELLPQFAEEKPPSDEAAPALP
jgi:hypothetical protein